jgi:outer membrane murein-binding lipoprotein Lpp
MLVGVLLLGWWQRNALYDWARLRDYAPSTEIAQLATDTTMTDYARHMYYVNHPDIKERTVFSSYCNIAAEQAAVLGCYKGGQRGIYLLQVTNAELAGIKQVTAAHEMLHAVYERLGSDERQRVNTMLQNYYDHQLTDESIKQTVDAYRKTEPDDLVNEMHSIFGTQVATLPTELGKYYEKYFTDRSKVIGYYSAYQQAFTGRQQRIDQYDAQLDSWKTQISQLESEVKAQQSDLQNRRDTLNRYRANGNAEAYNNGVDGFNAAVVSYNAKVSELQQLITDYNKLVETRNSIAFEERQLVNSLSSSGIEQQ